MITIKDIAKKAGVSRGTVDRVLHDRGKVAPEKEKKIRRIARELGYQPNIAGKGLAARKKHIKIGFVYVSSDQAPFHGVIYESALQYARQELQQYGVEVRFFPFDLKDYEENFREWDKRFIKVVREQKINGLAVVGMMGARLQQVLEKNGIVDLPFVLYNQDEDVKGKLAYVGCDYERAGRLACGLAALMTKNKAHVGIVSLDDGEMQSSVNRVAGFEAEIRERYPQIQIVEKYFTSNVRAMDELFSEVQQMMERHPDMDVLYLANPGDYSLCQSIRRSGRTSDIRIITNDLVTEWQREMVRNGTIDATICQEPEKQGIKPLEILFNYLALGIVPETEWYKTELSMRIGQNV